jgi:hypothetical protein
MNSGSQLPRVSPQRTFFPRNPKEVCEGINIKWWAALKLAEDGYISFDPEKIKELDDAQEAELVFVGSIGRDCTRRMLNFLLSGLEKPYNFRHDQIRFDWQNRKWCALPAPMDVFEEGYQQFKKKRDWNSDKELSRFQWDVATDLIENLRGAGDKDGLQNLAESVADAM